MTTALGEMVPRSRGRLQATWTALAARPRFILSVVVLTLFGPGLAGYFMHDFFRVILGYEAYPFGLLVRANSAPPFVWRSVYEILFYTQVRAFGHNPLGYYALGIGSYVGIVLLLFSVNRRVLPSPSAALAGTLFFALMPLRHQDVFFAPRTVSHMWMVLGVWCFTHPAYPRRWSFGVWGVLTMTLAFLSYELSLSAGAAVVVVSLLLRDRGPVARRVPELAARIVPIVILTLAYGLTRFVILKDSGITSGTGGQGGLFGDRGAGVLEYLGRATYFGVVSQFYPVNPDHHPVAKYIAILYPVLILLLVLAGGGLRGRFRPVAWLLAWWLGALVPAVDFLQAFAPESWRLFWAGWPLGVVLATLAPDPVRTRRGAWLWTALLLVAAICTGAETQTMLRRFGQMRAVVATFKEALAPPEEPTLVYVLNPPYSVADRPLATPLSAGLSFPYSPEARRRLIFCLDLDQPAVPVPHVPERVPARMTQRIRIRRWDDVAGRWVAEPLPEWVRPQSPDTPDLAVWDGPRHWERQGWEPNPHLVPAPRASADGWWATLSPYSLLFGPPLELGRVPLAYVEVTLAVQSPEPVNYAEWLFLTPDRGTFGGDSVFRFAIEADGAPHTYAVPLYHLPRTILEGPVTQLALRPVGTARALVRIDRIRLVPWKAPAAAP